MKEHASKCGFEKRLEQEIKHQITLRTNNNKLRRCAFKNPTLSLKDMPTYGNSLEEIDNKTEEMERKNQREEQIDKVVKKLLGKNCEKSKRNGCSRRTSHKVCFSCGGDFHHTGECPATGKNCHKCDKVGHFSRCGRSK